MLIYGIVGLGLMLLLAAQPHPQSHQSQRDHQEPVGDDLPVEVDDHVPRDGVEVRRRRLLGVRATGKQSHRDDEDAEPARHGRFTTRMR